MPVTHGRYSFTVVVPQPLDTLRASVEDALRTEGFGVLTEIDVQATLKAKLGVDLEPLVILGACNPPLAHVALTADPSIATLLPCNVVLRAVQGGTAVEFMDPEAGMALSGVPELATLGAEARARLLRVADALARGV